MPAALDGRDPVSDIEKINLELAKYSDKLAALPQVIGANKMDLPDAHVLYEELEDYCKAHDLPLFPISAATGEGVRALLDRVVQIRDSISDEPIIFEREYFAEEQEALSRLEEGDGIEIELQPDGTYWVGGPVIDKMLGFTHLESEKGFDFFQRFLRERGIIQRLEDMGIQEGDTVQVGDTAFEYYP